MSVGLKKRRTKRKDEGRKSFSLSVGLKKGPKIRKSLAGGYHFKRVQISGQERFKDQPNKNQHSHVGDALGYALLGGGEFRRLTRPNQTGFVRSALAKLDFDLW